jgi:HAD superfamily hydrolase (TIGR01490 family)
MNKARQHAQSIAAFFDIDGTLLARPSLELQYFARLRQQRAIRVKNYFLWLANAIRLAPKGLAVMRHANKMYLRGVPTVENSDTIAPRPRKTFRPRFLPDAIERLTWHAAQGHAIVLVSGTLAPLASGIAQGLTVLLTLRGISASIGVCATRLEEVDGRWTGRIEGEAMFGEAKARAILRLAAEAGFDLSRCYAYADSASDRWVLDAVGLATAVNPAHGLERIARNQGWPVLRWSHPTPLYRKVVDFAKYSRGPVQPGSRKPVPFPKRKKDQERHVSS